jgi:hypothetical protein
MQKMTTCAGKTPEQVRAIMLAHLEPEAYKAVGGRSYLTDINPAYMREALTDAFGLAGFGWWIEGITPEIKDTGVAEGKNLRWLGTMEVRLYYRFLLEGAAEWITSNPLIGFGVNRSDHPEDALKGAKTNGIGDACKELLWQLDVFKGKIGHDSKPERSNGKASASVGSDAEQKSERAPMAVDALQEVMRKKVEKIGQYEASGKFRNFIAGALRSLFPDSQDAEAEAHAVAEWLVGSPSTKAMTGAQVKAIRDWLGLSEGPDGKVVPCSAAMVEARHIVKQAMIGAGQSELPV